MKRVYSFATIRVLILSLFLGNACSGQPDPGKSKSMITEIAAIPKVDNQIAKYVVTLFEDSDGNLWMGTMSKGAVRYDGKMLSYYSMKDGLPSNTIADFTEDQEGNIWLATHAGLSKFDGTSFTNFRRTGSADENRISTFLIDRSGTFWIGTWEGVCTFNGRDFVDFEWPKPAITPPPYQQTMNWVTDIVEDQKGNIWVGRSGYGATKYDGQLFTHFTVEEGLPSNCIQAIMEDENGQIWFGARVAEKDYPDPLSRKGNGGLSVYNGSSMKQFKDIKGLSQNDIYTIYEDQNGDIWVGAAGVGAYRYDGNQFTLFKETDRQDLMPHGFGIQSILEDTNGILWFGLSGGLFRLTGATLTNVTQEGPWD